MRINAHWRAPGEPHVWEAEYQGWRATADDPKRAALELCRVILASEGPPRPTTVLGVAGPTPSARTVALAWDTYLNLAGLNVVFSPAPVPVDWLPSGVLA